MKLILEDYTIKECSICGAIHKNGRIYRGLYMCRKTKRKINTGINAALNIARRLGHRIRISRKIESYHVTHNGVKPLNPRQRANTRDPSIETPPLKDGEGVVACLVAEAIRTFIPPLGCYGYRVTVYNPFNTLPYIYALSPLTGNIYCWSHAAEAKTDP